MAGKLITILQLILSAGLLILVWNSGMVPGLYLALLGGGLLLLFAVTFCLQYVKSKVKYAGMVISILISIGLAVGIVYFLRIQQTMADVGGATYKTDNMIVVVKASDPAESILDAAKRELQEETGALEYTLAPVCVYSVTAPDTFQGKETFGMLFFAKIQSFAPELHSEIEKTVLSKELPENWTYPEIQPMLVTFAKERGYR